MTPKQAAAVAAADLVPSDAVIGLGTGSTADLFVRELARRLADGRVRDIVGVPTSQRTAALARELGVPLVAADDVPQEIAVTFDGADEVDPEGNLIKGGGGSLLREKIVAQASRRLVILVDPSKLVSRLGSTFPLPVDVVPFGWSAHDAFFRSLGLEPRARTLMSGGLFRTDEGNLVIDLDSRRSGGIEDPRGLDQILRARAGIVDTGLFLGMATEVIVGRPEGTETRRCSRSTA